MSHKESPGVEMMFIVTKICERPLGGAFENNVGRSKGQWCHCTALSTLLAAKLSTNFLAPINLSGKHYVIMTIPRRVNNNNWIKYNK